MLEEYNKRYREKRSKLNEVIENKKAEKELADNIEEIELSFYTLGRHEFKGVLRSDNAEQDIAEYSAKSNKLNIAFENWKKKAWKYRSRINP